MAKRFPMGCGIPSRRQFLRFSVVAGSAQLLAFSLASRSRAQETKMTWGQAVTVTRKQLATRPGYLPGDLLDRSEVEAVFDALKSVGWSVPEREKITELVLADSHFLVQELRTRAGVRFIRGVSHQKLVFDQLDRLAGMNGGQQLIRDIIRLPDGQRLMGSKPTAGFTDLTILLPKQANGKTPRNKDFQKPTGSIYTEAQLLEALEESWKSAQLGAGSKGGRRAT